MESPNTLEQMLKEGTLVSGNMLMATGVAMIVIGILAILSPLASGIVFDMLFGALFIGAGIVELVEAFGSRTWQRGVPLALAGLITLAAGALYIARPVVGLVALTVVFLAYLVFVGALRIVMAFQLPRGTPGKVMSFVSGIVALVLAYLAITRMPDVSVWLIGTFIGVSLIFAGAARLSFARGVRHLASVVSAPQLTFVSLELCDSEVRGG
jgi:uncharacterized membrane protein HdeD (DUF308 family)